MKKQIFCILLFCCPLLLQAQKNELGVVFQEVEHDFGVINETGGRVTHDFEFTNEGNAPVALKSVRASCGCTTPNWPKAPIAAGATGKISVTYNPQGRPGVFNKTITVVVGGEGNKQTTIILKIKGDVTRDKYPVKISGLNLERQKVTFQKMAQGETLTETISIYNNSGAPLTVSFPNCPKYLSVKIEPENPVAGQRSNELYEGQTAQLKITYNSKKSEQWGSHVDTLAIALNGKTLKDDNARLYVFSTLEERFDKLTPKQRLNAPIAEVEKSTISLGEVKKSATPTVTFMLKNSGVDPLKIRYIDPMCTFLSVKADKKVVESGKSVAIQVTVLPKDLPEIQFQKRIELVTNDPNRSKQYITLEWKVVK